MALQSPSGPFAVLLCPSVDHGADRGKTAEGPGLGVSRGSRVPQRPVGSGPHEHERAHGAAFIAAWQRESHRGFRGVRQSRRTPRSSPCALGSLSRSLRRCASPSENRDRTALTAADEDRLAAAILGRVLAVAPEGEHMAAPSQVSRLGGVTASTAPGMEAERRRPADKPAESPARTRGGSAGRLGSILRSDDSYQAIAKVEA